MHYQDSDFNSDLRRDKVLAFIQSGISDFKNIVNLDEGIYSALGDYAIYLRDGITNGSISDLYLKNVFKVINTMGASNDLEVQNLLVVGVFEILTDNVEVIEVIKRGLEGKAAQLFERVLIGWSQ